MQSNTDDASIGLDLEGKAQNIDSGALVTSGGKLPHSFQVSTTKLLDVIIALNPRSRSLDAKQRKKVRQSINQKLYNKTRPGLYLEVNKLLHLAYLGQPNGAKTQHQWRIFCSDS
ncbi:MAG: hypothetical protein KME42_22000 [Tildeniella nuda ZEHNDER 1965/U140]|jgi:hypothetical protein|nr:hypothetical protein [Tildeniella nuda ZEHNDER 1965/U140]